MRIAVFLYPKFGRSEVDGHLSHERTRDYTVMSNHHYRNANLSLKAKGLLSMMLSLPEDWNYTTRGLAKICKEGVDAIGAALQGNWRLPVTL